MSSAFEVGPESGVNRSADASGASASRAPTVMNASRGRRALKAADLYRLAPRELRLALLDEGPDALHEVLRARQGVLQLRLEVELAGHVRVEHAVQRLLRARVR